MSYIAIDKNGLEVNAFDINLSRSNEEFYCPTHNCKATFKLVSPTITERGSRNAHFSSRHSKYAHVPVCDFDNSSNSKNIDRDVTNFDIDLLLEKISTPQKIKEKVENNSKVNNDNAESSVPKKAPIKQVADLYRYCSSHSLDTEINGVKINDILVSSRNCEPYLNGIQGTKIVEVRYHKFYYNKQTNEFFVYCMMPHYKPVNEKPKFRLIFEDSFKFFKFISKYRDLSDDIIIRLCVLGNWNGTDCTITSLKQIAQLSKSYN